MAGTVIQVDVVGLKATLAELRTYDKELYKQIVDRLKTAAEPLARDVGRAFPMVQPLTNWHSEGGRRGKKRMPPYNVSKAQKGVKPYIYSGNRFVGKDVGIMRIQQMDAGGQVYDGAGSANAGARFVQNLDKRRAVKSKGDGFRSRVMYKAVERGLPMIEDEVRKAITQTDAIVRARIVSGY
jgi:hypothetical protein